VQKNNCYQDTWQNGQARYTHMCYSDLPYLYTGRGFAEVTWPYSDDAQVRERYPEVMEYPVGISYWAWGAAHVTHWLNGSPDLTSRSDRPASELGGLPEVQREMRIFVIVNALGFAVLTLLAAWLLAGVTPRRPWDAAAFALSPALLLTGLVNWDLVAVVFVAGALWAWTRDRPVLTGLMIGLGTAVKLYPLFLLGGILVICLRQRRTRALALASLAAAASWLLANLPAYLSGPAEWKVFWSFNSERGATSGRSGWSSSRRSTAPVTRSPSTRTRSTSGRGCSSGRGAWACWSSDSSRPRPLAWPSSASSSSRASCSSTRSTRRSTCCGCCRSPYSPGRAGAT